ncbi:recombinase family protein [Sphingomonas sp. 28-62-11]|uniref:recombinase family protein n=1 Tax=Sphingomonas sp. 28-62-11 TaxID=1970432 RepID=UPI000BCF78D7|nr:MAG: hypothetical protein B7Y49_07460 [Sphingomonas sp. 28-62-11]
MTGRIGDFIVVSRLDRFVRSTEGPTHKLLPILKVRGVGFHCLAQAGVDTMTPTGKLTLTILGAVATLEADLRAERKTLDLSGPRLGSSADNPGLYL